MIGRFATGRFAVAAWLILGPSLALADTYSCTSAKGQTYVRDRYIAECSDVRQTVRRADGSVKETIDPLLSPIDIEAAAQCKREQDAENARRHEGMLRDRNLIVRYPNEAAHAKARAAALDDAKRSIAQSEKRLVELGNERKPLNNEAEFYVGRQMPLPLKQSLDANDAATAAQRALIANQQGEIGRINALFDAELERLRRLWGGSPPGSLEPRAPVPPGCVRWLSK